MRVQFFNEQVVNCSKIASIALNFIEIPVSSLRESVVFKILIRIVTCLNECIHTKIELKVEFVACLSLSCKFCELDVGES